MLVAGCGDDGGGGGGESQTSGGETTAGDVGDVGDATEDGGSSGEAPAEDPLYSVGSIVADPLSRTLFVQTVRELSGTLDLSNAIEVPGNARHFAYGGAVYIGLGEEPTIERYVPDETDALQVDARLSFQQYGITSIPPALAFVDDHKAYLIMHDALVAVIFDPTEMLILGEIDLSSLAKPDLPLQTWFPTAHENRVYFPARRVNEISFNIDPLVSVAILDTDNDTLLTVAEDDRCVSATRPIVGEDGNIYVMGDGRNGVVQTVTELRGEEVPPTCLLRILAGETTFDPDFFVDVSEITGGRTAATQMWQVPSFPGSAFGKMYYEDEVPADFDVTGPNVWGLPVFKLWKINLGDEVTAAEAEVQPFSTIDFGAVPVDGQLYFGVTPTSGTTQVYRIDPETNVTTEAFEMTGSLRDMYRIRQ